MYRILKQIGLTSKEAEAYEALLRLGEVPVSEIVRETGDHSQIIYRAIDGLVALGLVAVSYQQHRKFVKAEDPTTLERLEEKRLEELRLVVPELLSIQRQAHNTSIIRTSKGNEAIRAMRLDSLERLKAGDCYYAIGATGDRYLEAMGQYYYEQTERRRIKKKIQRKMLSYDNQRDRWEYAKPYKELAETRYLPESYTIPATTNIHADVVTIIIWDDIPVVVTIESKAIAESYLHYFHMLWQIAKL